MVEHILLHVQAEIQLGDSSTLISVHMAHTITFRHVLRSFGHHPRDPDLHSLLCGLCRGFP